MFLVCGNVHQKLLYCAIRSLTPTLLVLDCWSSPHYSTISKIYNYYFPVTKSLRIGYELYLFWKYIRTLFFLSDFKIVFISFFLFLFLKYIYSWYYFLHISKPHRYEVLFDKKNITYIKNRYKQIFFSYDFSTKQCADRPVRGPSTG